MRVAAYVLAGMLLAFPLRAAEEIEWLAHESAGILPLSEERRVILRGVQGDIELRVSEKDDELRWYAFDKSGKTELPMAVGEASGELVVTAPPGDTAPRTLGLMVPARLAIELEVDASKVFATDLASSLSVKGRDLDLQLLSPMAVVELELQGGTARLDSAEGRVTIRGTPKQVTLVNPHAGVGLQLQGGAVELSGGTGGVDADCEQTTLKLFQMRGPCRMHARGGGIKIEDLQEGCDLDLSGTPLELINGGGEVTIRSDSSVQFNQCRANLRLQGIAAEVRGNEHVGLVEIVDDSAEVILARIDGPLRVQGNSLRLKLETIGGETGVITSGSSVTIVGVSGPLEIENDLGEVRVQGASDKVQVKNRGGDVSLLGLSGSAQVETDSDLLAVSWASVPMDPQIDNYLVNTRGEVRVELPAGGNLIVEAQSRYGHVESSLDWAPAAEDGKSAKGAQGRHGFARLRIMGEGGVVLGGPGGAKLEGGER